MSPYVSMAILFALCAIVVGVMVSLNRLLGPVAGGQVKSEPFECGNPPSSAVWGRFGFVEMLIFLAILGVGLLYAWRKGALEWD